LATIRKDILDAIVDKTGYSKRHVRRIIDEVIEASGYTIPNKRVGANILASKVRVKINEILSTDELAEVRRYLSEPTVRSIPIQLKSIKSKGRKTIRIDESASTENRVGQLLEENRRLSENLEQLRTEIKSLDRRSSLEKVAIPRQMRRYIEKAFSRIDQRSFSEAIMNCYRVSETLVNVLFSFLYPSSRDKKIKHEDKLKRIWNDEEKEKKEYPGIKVIASLLAIVLWYRNKMGAHTEMTPTEEAARTCITSLIQALVESERLGIKVGPRIRVRRAESIKNLTEEKIITLIKTLTSDQLKRLIQEVFDEVSMISGWTQVKDSQNFFDFIKYAIKERQKERTQLFEIFFDSFFPTSIIYGRKELLSTLRELVNIVSIRRWIIKKGHTDTLVSELVRSRSFDIAGINTEIILGFLQCLTTEQLNTIIDASISNDQIHGSYRAKTNLKAILAHCRGKVKEDKLEQLRNKLQED